MKLNEFISIFKESFDSLESSVSEETVYKKLDEWTSMQSLFFIAHLDDKISVVLNTEDLIETKTIGDLFIRVLKKIDKN